MVDNEIEDQADDPDNDKYVDFSFDDTEPNRKITQAFIDAMVALVPDGWRLIDYRIPVFGESFLDGSLEQWEIRTAADAEYLHERYIIERIPLTGRAWVIENLVARPWSVVRHDGVMYASMPTVDGMKIQTSHRNDYCYWLKGRWLHADDAPISEDMCDATVEWLYKADERSATDE